jgi:hypothetical protein
MLNRPAYVIPMNLRVAINASLVNTALFTELNPEAVDPLTPFIMPGIGQFAWTAADGRSVYLPEMDSSHLLNTTKMVWNHTTPYEWRELRYKVRDPPKHLLETGWGPSLPSLVQELVRRHRIDLLEGYAVEFLHHMTRCVNGRAPKRPTYEC